MEDGCRNLGKVRQSLHYGCGSPLEGQGVMGRSEEPHFGGVADALLRELATHPGVLQRRLLATGPQVRLIACAHKQR